MVTHLPPLSENERARLAYDAAMRQLERMRSMQYAYHQKFFSWIGFTLILLLALALWPGGLGWFFIPFLVISAGVQASFYLHFCDFARTHARLLETKLNHWLGARILMGAEIEALYFYDEKEPKISGFLPTTPGRFFSAFTLHWMMVWTVLFALGATFAFRALDPFWALAYLLGVLAWATANFGFIAWYFWNGRDEKAIDRLLDRHLFQTMDTSDG